MIFKHNYQNLTATDSELASAIVESNQQYYASDLLRIDSDIKTLTNVLDALIKLMPPETIEKLADEFGFIKTQVDHLK